MSSGNFALLACTSQLPAEGSGFGNFDVQYVKMDVLTTVNVKT
jgi:hypothetical protein